MVACAEAWRGDGAVLASPMGVIPTLGARLARLTFAPDLLLTDGEAYLVDEDGQVEGWLPYARVFTMLAAWLTQARDDGRGADRPVREIQEHLLDRRPGGARRRNLLGVRGAPGNTVNHPVSYWVPRHSPRVFTGHVDMVCGVGYDRGRPRAVRAARGGGDPTHVRRCSTSGFDSEGMAERVMPGCCSVHPGVEVADVLAATGFLRIVVPGRGAGHAGCPRRPSSTWILTRLDPDGARDRELA